MIKSIDFHSHILCGADHGSANSTTTLAQLELMCASGTSVAVATPHFYPEQHSLTEFLDVVAGAVNRISQMKLGKKLELCIGAEVLVCQGLERMEGLDKLCIRGTKCILLELPTASSWNHGILDTVEQIIDRRYTVVLAHIDRYLPSRERDIDYLLSLGAVAQINAPSLFMFGKKKKLLSYIDGGLVYALGSDLHGVDTKDYNLFATVEKRIGTDRFESIMSKTEELLENAERLTLN